MQRRRKALGFPGARAGTRAATPARAGSSGTRVCPHGSDMLDVPAWRLGRRNARPRPRGRADLRRAGGEVVPPRDATAGRRAMTSSSRRPRAPGERASGMRDARITRSVTGRTSSPPNHARLVLARARRRARRRASRTEKPSDPRRGRPPREKARHRGAALGARRARGWDRGRRRAVRLDEPGHAPW